MWLTSPGPTKMLEAEYTPSGELDGLASVRVPLQAGVACAVEAGAGLSVAVAAEQAPLVWWSVGLSGSGDGRAMEARCTGAKRDGRLVWRRLAAHGSSTSLVEESAQDRDLEERVERHVVCARASGLQG